MTREITYYRRSATGDVQSGNSAADIFPDWQGERESWLFVAPHDDDIVAGAGLILVAAVAEKINVHCVVTSDGRMGYCSPEERLTITQVRRKETADSFRVLGVPDANVRFLNFPDGNLGSFVGRRLAEKEDPAAIEGYTGLENAYVHAIRKAVPTRVFIPSSADLHPDHKNVNLEMQISLIHACSTIWPELGEGIPALPAVYEYATYSDFIEIPQIKLVTSNELLERKMAGVLAYVSQKQIEAIIQLLREAGPIEYIRELNFHRYSPQNYKGIF